MNWLKANIKVIAIVLSCFTGFSGATTVLLSWIEWRPASRQDVISLGDRVRLELKSELSKLVKVTIELTRAERARLRVSYQANLARRKIATDAALIEALDRLIQQEDEALMDVNERIGALERLRGSD